jgi:hypothetical protein
MEVRLNAVTLSVGDRRTLAQGRTARSGLPAMDTYFSVLREFFGSESTDVTVERCFVAAGEKLKSDAVVAATSVPSDVEFHALRIL